MPEFKIEINLRIVECIEAETRQDAINKFSDALKWPGEALIEDFFVEQIDE